MTSDQARLLFPDYLDGSIRHEDRERLRALCEQDPDLSVELANYERVVNVLNHTEPPSPRLDMWQAIVPFVDQYRTELRNSPIRRIHVLWLRIAAQFSSGLIIYTHYLANRTQARFEKYLLHDPLAEYRRRNVSE